MRNLSSRPSEGFGPVVATGAVVGVPPLAATAVLVVPTVEDSLVVAGKPLVQQGWLAAG